MPTSLPLFDAAEAEQAKFGGPDIQPADARRMSRQLAAVYEVMSDGRWRTLKEIFNALTRRDILATTQGISARLRDLRKPAFGSHAVDRRRRTQGEWEYRLTIKAKPGQTPEDHAKQSQLVARHPASI